MVLFTAAINASIQKDEKLEQIFKASRAAVGTEEEIGKISNIDTSADCVGPKGDYQTRVKSFRANKTFFVQTFSYKNDVTVLFIKNSVGWKRNAIKRSFEPVSEFEKLVVNLHEYQKLAFDFRNIFTDFKYERLELFEGRASHKVSAKTKIGTNIELFFDGKTKRLAGYILPIPDSKTPVKNVFNEWKLVGKVTLPSVVTATDSAGKWVLKFKRIELNKTDEDEPQLSSTLDDLNELMRLHKEHKTAHLTYDAELFIKSFADDLPQLQSGKVRTGTQAENLARFNKYFASYKFLEWEDINPPSIKISKDGTLATKIVEKRVRGTYKNEKGEEETDHTIFAWLEVWEKIDGEWKVSAVASTSKSAK